MRQRIWRQLRRSHRRYENIGKIGGKPKGVRDVIQGSGKGGTSFRVGDTAVNPLMSHDFTIGEIGSFKR